MVTPPCPWVGCSNTGLSEEIWACVFLWHFAALTLFFTLLRKAPIELASAFQNLLCAGQWWGPGTGLPEELWMPHAWESGSVGWGLEPIGLEKHIPAHGRKLEQDDI